jgi:succinate dehydrogenase / fumarate reductase cytochrome b subunit
MHAPGSPSSPAPVWQRVFVWTGAVPLAGFVLVHVLAQGAALWGPNAYARLVARATSPWSLLLDLLLVYVPLLLHAALGLRRAVGAGGSGASAAEIVQRLSAVALLVFLLLHVWQFPARVWRGELDPVDYYPELCASLSSTAWGGVPLVAIGYLVGVAAAALHGAGGVYRAALSSGLVSAARQRLLLRCCSAVGVAVFVLGALIVIDLATGSVLIHLRG